jgi:hypothetical protein
MKQDWDLAYILPHTRFDDPIEHGPLALVPPQDSRLVELASASRAISKLTSCFTDQFGEKIEPSAILIHSNAPKDIDFYAVVCFRNSVAIASIIDAATHQYSGGRAGYPQWSDYFDIYAFTADRDDDLTAKSLASWEINHPDQFFGQRAPHLASNDHLSFGLDKEILNGCLCQWDRRFIKKRQEWSTRVLFRSLEIACQACRVPAVGTRTPTIHDMGVGIALWVSAFEILSHPRTSNANLGTVLNLLDSANWLDSNLRSTRCRITHQGRSKSVNWIQKFYKELYDARNSFLHGNPVSPGRLFPKNKSGGPTLLHVAPLLYRTALNSVLPSPPKKSAGSDLTSQLTAYLLQSQVQRRYEKAVLRCRPRNKKTR